MIKSMTGFGGAEGALDGLKLSIELKSVNNRYLDVTVRMPRGYIFAEESIKAAVSGYISRGKVDVFITLNSAGADSVIVSVNEALAEAYITALRSISDKFGVKDEISNVDVARFSDVLSAEKKEADRDKVLECILSVLDDALREFSKMREFEGEKLRIDILSHLSEIELLLSFIEERSPQTVLEYRSRLEQKMREILETSGIDESRILMEAAIFSDRVTVDEELVRLRSHISQMRELIEGGSPVGRKLDFLIQEFNREANTIGSKCNNADISKTVVNLKSEIEKLREQLQNIE